MTGSQCLSDVPTVTCSSWRLRAMHCGIGLFYLELGSGTAYCDFFVGVIILNEWISGLWQYVSLLADQ